MSGDGEPEAVPLIERLTPDRLLVRPVARPEHAQALLAGLWLWHDWLDRSHTISQGLHGGTGSFWHAIMHRREGDFPNSKYWYNRVADHPTYGTLAARAADLVNPFPADKSLFRIVASGWNPGGLVDLVEQVHDRPDDPRFTLCVALQQLEWRTLFDYCAREAAGG